jgi:hypothetical protein
MNKNAVNKQFCKNRESRDLQSQPFHYPATSIANALRRYMPSKINIQIKRIRSITVELYP